MKKMIKIVTAAAVMAPGFAHAGKIGQDLGNLSRDTSKAISNSAESIEQALKDVSLATVTFSQNSSHVVSTELQESLNTSKNLAIKGWALSEKGATLVVGSSVAASQEAEKIGRKVITASGKMFEASLDESKEAIHVSVRISEDAEGIAINIFNESKTAAIGSLRVSKEVASNILKSAKRAGDQIEDGAEYMMDAAGRLIRKGANETSEVLGRASNEASEAITFVVDKTGHLLSISANESVAIIRGAGNALKDFASATLAVSQKAGEGIAQGLRVSARGSMMILNASGKTIRLLSEDVEGMFKSMKVEDKD